MHTTQQSYQIIISKKYLFLANPEPFLTKITAPAKYGSSRLRNPGFRGIYQHENNSSNIQFKINTNLGYNIKKKCIKKKENFYIQ